MIPALYDDQRSQLARVAAMLVLAGASILPIAGQDSAIASARDKDSVGAITIPTIPGKLTYPDIVIKRDPFRADQFLAGGIGFSRSDGDMKIGQADQIGVVLPPNAGAGDPQPVVPAGAGAIVRAVITGGRGRALVDIGGSVQVFTVGDRIADQSIASIDQAGVHLSDGTTLPLAGEK